MKSASRLAPRTRRQRKQRVLDWINGVRATEGEQPLTKLPKGADPSKPFGEGPFLSSNCPVALALQTPRASAGSTQSSTIWFNKTAGTTWLAHPSFVRDFITDYDAGCYPELIER